jgi:hypothetical protein
MKRFLSFLILGAFIFTSNVMSQSLQLSDVSGSVANGTDFYVWGDTITGTLMSQKIGVKNISAASVTVKTKKIETSLIPGTSCNMCFAGQCFLSSVFISNTQATLAPNDTNNTGSIEYKPKGHLGESIVTYVFFDIGNPNDSAWVVVHFNGTPAGISENMISKTEISNPYPNPAVDHTTFNYSFAQNTTSAKFVLCDLLGSKVIETEINDLNGVLNVNTSNLNGGIYFYSFYADNKMVLTRKLVVKK